MFRIISTIILILAIVLLPYWLYVPAIFVAMVYFHFFWEGVGLGFIIDILYGYGTGFSQYPFALSALAVLLIMLPLRDRLRINV